MVYEASRQYNLKDIATQTVLYASTYVGFVLFVSECGCRVAYGMEAVCLYVVFAQLVYDAIYGCLVVVIYIGGTHAHYCHIVVEMVEHYYISVEYVHHVGSIVLFHCLVLYVNVLKISHGIERCVSVQSAHIAVVAAYLKTGYKLVDGVIGSELFAYRMTCGFSVRI